MQVSGFVDGGHERQLCGSALARNVYFNGQSVKNYRVKKSHNTLKFVVATRISLLMLVGNTQVITHGDLLDRVVIISVVVLGPVLSKGKPSRYHAMSARTLSVFPSPISCFV